MGRRPEGGISKRTDGRFVVTVQVNGRRIWRYARSEREARALLDALRRELVLGVLQPPVRMTLGDWLAQDRRLREGQGLRASTLATERQALAPVERAIGHVKLHAITPAMLAATLADLRRAGLGPRRVQLAHACLRASLGRAVALGLLTKNPVDGVPRPRHEPGEKATWTGEQARRFVQTALSDRSRYGPAFVLQLACGLRPSELLGLRWQDWNEAEGTLAVRRAIVWMRNSTFAETPPKSAAGRRQVTVPAVGRAALARLRAQAPGAGPDDRIVVARNGVVPRPAALSKALAGLCGRAGVPRVTPHTLRRVHIALLTGAGFDPKAVQRRAGHSRLSVTLDTYAYAVESDRAAARLLDRELSGPGTGAGAGVENDGGVTATDKWPSGGGGTGDEPLTDGQGLVPSV